MFSLTLGFAIPCAAERAAGTPSAEYSPDKKAFDPNKVKGLPTDGPNCYFTALTVNSLLDVPVAAFDDKQASLLFANPALCDKVTSPQLGDIGLVDDMNILAHVYTYIRADQVFEKAGNQANQPYRFTTPDKRPTRFVRCRNMQNWVDASMRQLPNEFRNLDRRLVKIEGLLDLRNGPKSEKKFKQLSEAQRDLEASFKDLDQRLLQEVTKALAAKGISKAPFPGMMNNEYNDFAKSHPEVLKDPRIFGLLWLSARRAATSEKVLYYNKP